MPTLYRIRSSSCFRKVRAILTMSHPNHTARVWLVGYLESCGYSKHEIQSIIDDFNQWKDYDEEFTEYMVMSFIPGNFSLDSQQQRDKCDKPARHAVRPITSPMVRFKDDFNRQFFWGAREVAIQYDGERFFRDPRSANPMRVPVFRSIEGLFHVLFVADFDDPDLDENLKSARAISDYWHWDFVKYTGNKSIHMVKKMPHAGAFGGMDYSELISTADKMEKGYGVSLDRMMFRPRQLIRGYCIHNKTGLMGCPVDLKNDNASTIETRSEQFALVDE